MSPTAKTVQEVRIDIRDLEQRFPNLRVALSALRQGQLGRIIVSSEDGEQAFTREELGTLYCVLIEHMQSGAVAIDDEDRIQYCNPYFADLTACSRNELISAPVRRFMAPEAVSGWEAFLEAIRTEGVASSELRIRSSDGVDIPVLVSGNLLPEDHGSVICVTVTDLRAQQYTDQLAAAREALAQALAETERRAREAEDGRVRLETMMTRYQKLNDTLEERVSQGVAVAEQRAAQLGILASHLTHAEQRERRRLAQLLHDHLQQFLVGARLKLGIVRQRVGEPDNSDLLNQVDELLKTSIEASRSLSVELSPPILYEGGLVRALEWLARQFGEKHDLQVTIEADEEAEPQTEDMRVALFHAVRELLFNVAKHAGVSEARVGMRRLDSRHIELVVADSGAGFDMESLKKPGAGGGLGLFSLRERLGLLGIGMQITSKPAEGTTATLVARVDAPSPLHVDEGTEVGSTASAQMGSPGQGGQIASSGKIRILLADDHKIVREGLLGLLDGEPDLEVVGEAADGRMAIRMARELNPDVIIMDVTMPQLSGLEATRTISATMPHIRIIGLSAHEEEDMASSLIKAGASAYLSKGGPSQDLIAIIRACCGRTADVVS